MELDHPLLAIAHTPISEDAPCGINAKYEANFEALEIELAKQESLTAEKVDWKEVKALATDLLQNTTKDFLVTCYLTHSLSVTEGYAGLLVGCKIIEGLIENFWQESFPPAKRLRARKTAIEWLVEKTTQYVETTPPTNNDNQTVIEIAKSIKNLDFAFSDKMEAQSPNMAELNRSFKKLKQAAEFELKATAEKSPPTAAAPQLTPTVDHSEATSATAIAEPPPAAPATPTTSSTTSSTTPATASTARSTSNTTSNTTVTLNNSTLTSESDAKKLYKQVQDALRQLADFHAGQKASDPKRYRYSRAALWDSLEKLPPHKEGKTQLPKPTPDKLKKLQELFDQGDFIAVLDQAEKSASKMPYWFDGQRMIANSLTALGGEFTKAAEALMDELNQFLMRIPNIINLCYVDGTPFADEQTLFWINTQVISNHPPGNSDQKNDAIQDGFLEAQKLASSGKLTESLNLLKNQPSKSLRNEYQIKLAIAELVAQSGQVKVAISLLERLINETKRISAIDWETDFTIKAYSILVQAYDKLDGDDAVQKQQQKTNAFDQLCWLDPAAVSE